MRRLRCWNYERIKGDGTFNQYVIQNMVTTYYIMWQSFSKLKFLKKLNNFTILIWLTIILFFNFFAFNSVLNSIFPLNYLYTFWIIISAKFLIGKIVIVKIWIKLLLVFPKLKWKIGLSNFIHKKHFNLNIIQLK